MQTIKKQINIKNMSGVVTNTSGIKEESEAKIWLDKQEAMGNFGPKLIMGEREVEVTPAVKDEQGNIVTPAVTKKEPYVVQPGYIVEIEDVTVKVEADELAKKTKKDAQAAAKTMLKSYKNGTFKVTKLKDLDDLLLKILDLIDLDGE